MVYGQGKSRAVIVLNLQSDEVIQELPSVAAVARTFFKNTKDYTARNRLQKALNKAQTSSNPYASILTDIPGYVAGFAWAKPGQKVRARFRNSSRQCEKVPAAADVQRLQVRVRHVPTGCLAANKAQTSSDQAPAFHELAVRPAHKLLTEMPLSGDWPEHTQKLWSSRLCTYEASAYADISKFPDQRCPLAQVISCRGMKWISHSGSTWCSARSFSNLVSHPA